MKIFEIINHWPPALFWALTKIEHHWRGFAEFHSAHFQGGSARHLAFIVCLLSVFSSLVSLVRILCNMALCFGGPNASFWADSSGQSLCHECPWMSWDSDQSMPIMCCFADIHWPWPSCILCWWQRLQVLPTNSSMLDPQLSHDSLHRRCRGKAEPTAQFCATS